MLISDWSSDVCSSDLFSSPPGRHLLVCFPFKGKSLPPRRRGPGWGWVLPGQEESPSPPNPPLEGEGFKAATSARARHHPARSSSPRRDPAARRDRKRVGQGKSVSVRVNFGGPRTIKKKKKQK